MAKVVLDIIANTGPLSEVAKGMADVSTASKKSGEDQKKAFKDAGQGAEEFKKKFNDIPAAVKKADDALRTLKSSIKEYKAEALKAGEATPIGKEFLKKAAEAQDRLGDLNQAVTKLASDTSLFDGFLQGGKLIASGFAIAQGGAALFGDENKDLEKQLVKVQGAIALLNGLTEIQSGLQKESAIRIGISSVATRIQATATGIYSGQISIATIVTNVFNASIKALTGPIGIILGLVGVAAGAFFAFSSETESSSDKVERLQKSIQGLNEDFENQEKLIKARIDLLKSEGATDQDVTKLTASLASQKIDNLKSEIKAQQQIVQSSDKKDLEENTKKLKQLNTDLEVAEIQKSVILTDAFNKSIQTKISNAEKENQRLIDVAKAKENNEAEIFRLEQKKLQDNIDVLLDIKAREGKDTKGLNTEQEDQLKDFLTKQEVLRETFRGVLIKKEEELADKKQKLFERELELKKKQVEIFEKLSKEELIKTLKVAELEADGKEAFLKSQFASREISEFEFEEKLRQLKLDALNKQLKDLQDYAGTVAGTDLDIATKKAEIATMSADNAILQSQREFEAKKALAEAEVSITEAKYGAINGLIGVFAAATKQDAGIQAALFAFEKILAVSQIIVQLQVEKAKNAAANALAGVAGLPITLAQNQASNLRAATGIAAIIAQAIPQITGFKKGGYTGEFGVDEISGVTHGREFVHTAEKTKKHRTLFEAIHSDDYSKVKLLDLAPLLHGTGISLNPETPIKINKAHNELSELKAREKSQSGMELKAMRKEMKNFFNHYKQKPNETVMPDGTRIIKIGSATRIIKKK